jgi:hypothetical protein
MDIAAAALGSLPTPLAAFADWLNLVTPAATPEQLDERTRDRIDRAARPLNQRGELHEADCSQLGQLSPPHTPVGLPSRGLDRLWDLLNGRTPQPRPGKPNARRQERGHER